jgi:hypothetical protein
MKGSEMVRLNTRNRAEEFHLPSLHEPVRKANRGGRLFYIHGFDKLHFLSVNLPNFDLNSTIVSEKKKGNSHHSESPLESICEN